MFCVHLMIVDVLCKHLSILLLCEWLANSRDAARDRKDVSLGLFVDTKNEIRNV